MRLTASVDAREDARTGAEASKPEPLLDAKLARSVPCPRCKTPTLYRLDNPFRPFCGERCKLIDLGAWANESFRLEVGPPDALPADGTVPG